MKSILSKCQNTINVLLPIIITVCTFYSSSLGQRISEIYADYIIDTNTLNNSFITLAITASIQDSESFQKIKGDLNEQMKQFNEKYSKEEKERRIIETRKLWTDRLTYTLALILIVFNVLITTEKVMPTRVFQGNDST